MENVHILQKIARILVYNVWVIMYNKKYQNYILFTINYTFYKYQINNAMIFW